MSGGESGIQKYLRPHIIISAEYLRGSSREMRLDKVTVADDARELVFDPPPPGVSPANQ